MLVNKFQSYEEVMIQPEGELLDNHDITASPEEANQYIGRVGVVMGMTETDDYSEIIYAVTFDHMDEDATYYFREKDLVSTGVIRKKEEFMSGESIRVRVDPETGEGHLVDD